MHENLTQLGTKTPIPSSPNLAMLEAIPWQGVVPISARFACPEFTSLCPVTGQPDFAHIIIDYVPNGYLVESKSLKLFLHSFRNHAGFHEKVTDMIHERFSNVCQPHWCRVAAFWYPRGGIPIDVVVQTGELPDSVHILPLDIPNYRAR